jgi:hypothetical protein
VQEAAAAAGSIVHARGLRERVAGRIWLSRFYRVVGGLVLVLQGVDSGIAITEYVQDMIGDGTEDGQPTATHGEPSDEMEDVPS